MKLLVTIKSSWTVLLLWLILCGVLIENVGVCEGGLPGLALRQSMLSQIGMGIAGSIVPKNLTRSKRVPARYVGAVMAILGTFHEAGVLPQEVDPRANQLIRSLIQFQSVFMKSQEPEVQTFISSALSFREGRNGAKLLDSFYEKGWTSETLEALVEYSLQHPMEDNPRIESAFQSYHLSKDDWGLIEEVFLKARREFVRQDQDLHEVFVRQRQLMPGGGR